MGLKRAEHVAAFSQPSLFVVQGCTPAPAPAPPTTPPPWSSSPPPPAPPLPRSCQPDSTGWTETWAALTTCRRWLPWTEQEMGECHIGRGSRDSAPPPPPSGSLITQQRISVLKVHNKVSKNSQQTKMEEKMSHLKEVEKPKPEVIDS